MGEKHPLLLPLAALVTGSIVAVQLELQVPLPVPGLVLALTVVSALWRHPLPFCLLQLLFWSTWGAAAMAPYIGQPSLTGDLLPYLGHQVTVEGIVARRPLVTQQGQRLELQLEQLVLRSGEGRKVSARLLLTIGKGQAAVLTGDRIRCPAVLKMPRKLGLPGEFDYSRHLALHRIDATGWIADSRMVVLMRGAAVPSLYRWFDQAADTTAQVLRRQLPDQDRQAVVMALATGSQGELSSELAAAYARAGVSHILSVSGFHVGIVTFVWVLLVRWLLLRWEWLAVRITVVRWAMLSAMPLMVAYLLFTGAAPATVRAVLMLAAVVLALWREQQSDPLDALLAAGFLMLLVEPAILFDLSFQLSFLSLWGLVVLTPRFIRPFEGLCQRPWQRTLLVSCSASAAAMLATLPLVLYSFHQASATGLVANLLVVPLLGYGATVLATAAVPFTLVAPVLGEPLLIVAGWLAAWSNRLIELLARLPVVHWYRANRFDLLATLLLLALISFVRPSRKRTVSACCLVAALVLAHVCSGQGKDGTLRITFLSVGQGDATLVTLPDNRHILIDGGGYLHETGRDFGERYLVPALYALGVERLEAMVLTHPHPDHLGGLPAVAERFSVAEFWFGESGEGASSQRLVKALHGQKTVFRVLKAGDEPLVAGQCRLQVLAPAQAADAAAELNDRSLVLLLSFQQFRALLMGDAGVAEEEQLLRQQIAPATVLKVGHHGSRFSSSSRFLAAVQPQIAVLSAGAGNRFGLPAQETLDRLASAGATVCRTDQQGTLLLRTDGTRVTISSYQEKYWRPPAVQHGFVLTGVKELR